jgi:sarcosine oxidase subunit delta
MLRIACPYCGVRDQIEFAYGGDAVSGFPDLAVADLDRWSDAVFIRDYPRGEHREFWQHQHGCRQWLHVVRDTVTHEIASVAPAREATRAANGDGVSKR